MKGRKQNIIGFFLVFLITQSAESQTSLASIQHITQQYDTLLNQVAENKIGAGGRRTGIWDFSVKENAYYGNYWQDMDTTHGRFRLDTGIIRMRGHYRKGVPYGVWIRYMKGYQYGYNYREYFFFHKNVCYKQIYFDRHNMWWIYDSLCPTMDTLITPLYSTPLEYDIYERSCGKKSTFKLGDKWLLPKESGREFRRMRRNDDFMFLTYDSIGNIILDSSISKKGDTTIVSIYLDDGVWFDRYYLNWPANKTPARSKKYRLENQLEIEIKDP